MIVLSNREAAVIRDAIARIRKEIRAGRPVRNREWNQCDKIDVALSNAERRRRLPRDGEGGEPIDIFNV